MKIKKIWETLYSTKCFGIIFVWLTPLQYNNLSQIWLLSHSFFALNNKSTGHTMRVTRKQRLLLLLGTDWENLGMFYFNLYIVQFVENFTCWLGHVYLVVVTYSYIELMLKNVSRCIWHRLIPHNRNVLKWKILLKELVSRHY